MQTNVVKKSSWHFRFQSFMGLNPEERTNICSYWRGVIGSFLKVLFFGIVIIIGIIVWGGLSHFAFFGEEANITILSFITAFLGMIIAVIAFMFCLVLILVAPSTIKEIVTKQRSDNPSVIRLKYESWKNKICTKISFE